MKEGEKREFNNLIKTVYDVYKLECTQKSYDGWWNSLGQFPFNIVQSVFDKYVDNYDKLIHKVIVNNCQKELQSNIVVAEQVTKEQAVEFKAKANEVVKESKKLKQTSKANKDWAKKIMDNQSAYPSISIEYAKQALNISSNLE
jgi:TRAP-type mannitol/chloroaromatic compound transport system substrate-binding protein